MATLAFASPTAAPLPLRQHGAYAVIRDPAERVLVVRTDSGRCYLPGGRIEPGETARAALLREIAEECGWSAEILAPLTRARQPILADSVTLDARYFRARLVAPLNTEGEHAATWLPVADALRRLHRSSEIDAVSAAIDLS